MLTTLLTLFVTFLTLTRAIVLKSWYDMVIWRKGMKTFICVLDDLNYGWKTLDRKGMDRVLIPAGSQSIQVVHASSMKSAINKFKKHWRKSGQPNIDNFWDDKWVQEIGVQGISIVLE